MFIKAKKSAAVAPMALSGTVRIGPCGEIRRAWNFRHYASKLQLSVRRVIVAGLTATTVAGCVALGSTSALADGTRLCRSHALCTHSARAYVNSYDGYGSSNMFEGFLDYYALPTGTAARAAGMRRMDLVNTDGISAPHGHYGWEY